MRSTTQPWGIIFYRAAALLAVLIALFAVFNFFDNLSEGEPVVPLFALALAAIVWMIGLAAATYRMPAKTRASSRRPSGYDRWTVEFGEEVRHAKRETTCSPGNLPARA